MAAVPIPFTISEQQELKGDANLTLPIDLQDLKKPSKTRLFFAKLKGIKSHNLVIQLKGFLKPKSCINVSYRIDVFSSTHKLIKTTGDRPCHSFVIGFLKTLDYMMGHTYGAVSPGTAAVVDDTGATKGYYNSPTTGTAAYGFYYQNAVEAGVGNAAYGLQVGNGSYDPVTVDFALNGKLAQGTGANQVQYGSCGVASTFIGSNFIILPIMRMVSNGSAAQIDITEIGVMIDFYSASPVGECYLLWLKDYFAAFALPAGSYAMIYVHIRTELA